MFRTKFGLTGRLTALLLVFAMVFVAGCQAVTGVDLNKAIINAMKVSSSEGKQTLELNLQLDDKALEGLYEEEIALLKLASHIKLQIDNIKAQDNQHMSFDGKLILGESASIGFSLKMDDKLAVLELEGAKAPFEIDLTNESLLNYYGLEDLPRAGSTKGELALTEVGHQLLDTVGAYAVNNLPNPERIAVKTVNEPINGISTSLMQVHADFNGPEIWEWLKKYVNALAADRDGLTKMITGLFELLEKNPDLLAAAEQASPLGDAVLDAPTKEEQIKSAASEIAEMLTDLQQWMKSIENDDREVLDKLLNKDLTIKADFYVDGKLDIRKQVLELAYTPNAELVGTCCRSRAYR